MSNWSARESYRPRTKMMGGPLYKAANESLSRQVRVLTGSSERHGAVDEPRVEGECRVPNYLIKDVTGS